MKLHISNCTHIINSLLLIIPLTACSPSPEQVPKIAEESRATLDKAKSVAAETEKTVDEAKQKIDEQSQ